MDGTIEIKRKLQSNGRSKYYYACPICNGPNIRLEAISYYNDDQRKVIVTCPDCNYKQKYNRLTVIYNR